MSGHVWIHHDYSPHFSMCLVCGLARIQVEDAPNPEYHYLQKDSHDVAMTVEELECSGDKAVKEFECQEGKA